MIDFLTNSKEKISRFLATKLGKRLMTGLRLLVGGVVVFILVNQLSTIGWKSLMSNMPKTPWFYLILGIMYVILPVWETGVYGSFFPVPKRNLFSLFIRKKVLNSDLMGYSGDVFVLYWLKDRLNISKGKVFRFMVDNSLTSSLGAFSATGLLFSLLVLTDSIRWGDVVSENNPMVLFGVAMLVAVMTMVGYQFRHTIFSLPGKSVLRLYLAHFVRFSLNFGLQILQWWVVLPFMPFDVWGTMLAIVTISNRLPFIPAKDLLAVSVILGVSGVVEGSEAAISAMLLTRLALDRVLNLSFFIPLSLYDRKKK